MDMSKYKSMFISETQEHLQSMNQGLLAIEKDPKAGDAIAEVFRNAHSIKGMAASMGYETIRDLAHAMEDLMDDVREGTRAPEAAVMDLLFKGLDVLEKTLRDVDQDREQSSDGPELAGRIRAFRGETVAAPAAPADSEAAPGSGPPASGPPAEENKPAKPTRMISFDAEIDFEVGPAKKTAKPAAPAEPPGPKPEAAPPKPERIAAPALPSENIELSVPGPPAAERDDKKKKSRPIEITSDDDLVFTPSPAPAKAVVPAKPVPAEAQAPAPVPAVPAGPAGPAVPAAPAAPSLEDELSEEDAQPGAAAEKLTVRVVFSPQTAAPGVRGLILFKRLAEVGEVLESRPAAGEVKMGNFLSDPKGLAVEVDLVAERGREELIRAVNSMADLQEYEIKSTAAAAESGPSPEGEDGGAEGDAPRPEAGYDPFAQVQALPQTVRVKTTALDQFINALGEMILVKNELREVARRHPIRPLVDGLAKLETLVRDFNDQVMSIRMMPLQSVVQRLPRVVRDLARDEKKKVRLEVRGQDIEIDRAILEQLSDPLIHLLRNCVGHGIEPPAERSRMGKAEEGLIVIEAYRARDLIQIEVRDDGRGIDPHQLRDTAVVKGIIGADEAQALSDEAAYQLIFMPGFSTAKVVGMVSGRGVGMDAVKSVVENLGGYVTLMSSLGRGTTFTLHLPRTIAIVHVLLVRIAQEIFAVPIAKVLKTVEILPHQVRKSQGQSFFLERQELIPMKPLHRLLDLPDPKPAGRDPVPALIVEVHKRKNALVVDELRGQEEAFIRPLGKPLEKITGLSGVTMLGDGRLVFVLDTMSLM